MRSPKNNGANAEKTRWVCRNSTNSPICEGKSWLQCEEIVRAFEHNLQMFVDIVREAKPFPS
jgi:hypothetical protein